MEIIKINPNDISREQIDIIVNFLNNGKVIAYPTDTIYGLGCDARNVKAVNKIYSIKEREKKKPMIILAASIAMVKRYCYVTKKQEEYLGKIWPGSVTVILKSKKLLAGILAGSEGTQSVRLPDNDFLLKIIKQLKAPIVSTSLNKSGEEPVKEIKDIEKYFSGSKPDLIIDGGKLGGKPSRVVDIRDMDNINVLRKG